MTLQVPRRAYISGGTGAIGSALVRQFVNEGYSVEFSYHESEAEADDLSANYGVVKYRINFLEPWQPPSTQADVLVNNAGINLSGHGWNQTSDDEIQRTIEVNLLAAFSLARHFVPNMVRNGFGRIININSLYGLTAPPLRLSYTISKFALRAMTRCLAQELAGLGITVNDICPGPVDSEMLRGMGTKAVQDGRYQNLEDYLAAVRREVPLGRLIEPNEVSAVAIFLASKAAGACTGQAILVDGGLLN